MREKILMISTIGIMRRPRPIATRYSSQPMATMPKSFAIGSMSTTSEVRRRESAPAPQSQRFCPLIVKMEPWRERILKEWKTSHIASVRNAMVVPWTLSVISKVPVSK